MLDKNYDYIIGPFITTKHLLVILVMLFNNIQQLDRNKGFKPQAQKVEVMNFVVKFEKMKQPCVQHWWIANMCKWHHSSNYPEGEYPQTPHYC